MQAKSSHTETGPAAKPQLRGWGAGALDSEAARLKRRYPTIADLEKKAARRIPRFAFDYVDSGVGDDKALIRNRAAMDAIEIVPRYGIDMKAVSTDVTLFGRSYSMPVGVSPLGMTGLIWPLADAMIARAAQKARIPYVLSTVSNVPMETIARIAPDVFWFQLYAVPHDDFKVSIDLARRAEALGAHALVLTLDTPARQKRVRDVRNGLVVPFRPSMRTVIDVAKAPLWALATLRQGQPKFANFAPYLEAGASAADSARYVYEKMAGAITWELVARMRDIWKGPLIVKGVQHPDDVEQAAGIGLNGVILSNHGGRQFDAAPAAIDVLPAIKARTGKKLTIMADGSARSGLDVLRYLALGADFTFAGRAFLLGAAAIGEKGPHHVATMFQEELRGVLAQSGATNPAGATTLTVRHPGALSFPPSRRKAL
ncbi:MAG: alpha-hydroxy-acid oxidizing protein [Rhizobiaceae bacterium]|nr:alpha-hydroxy-acid oxidizing protein [Rhizobiaceae bacterium]